MVKMPEEQVGKQFYYSSKSFWDYFNVDFFGDNLYHGDDHGDDHGNDHCGDHGDDNGDDQGGDYGDDHGDDPTRSG